MALLSKKILRTARTRAPSLLGQTLRSLTELVRKLAWLGHFLVSPKKERAIVLTFNLLINLSCTKIIRYKSVFEFFYFLLKQCQSKQV